MTSTQTSSHEATDLSALVRLEEETANLLDEMIYDVEHSECFDPEQRAEIHTLLSALHADTELHRQLVAEWARTHAGRYASDV